MKSFKKFISIFLAVLMLCSVMAVSGISASAADYSKYSLIGYINGADLGDAGDYANVPNVFAADGTQTLTFTETSYVCVKTTDNTTWYMFDEFCQDTTGTLKKTAEGTSEKMMVPAGTFTFTLVENSDGTLTLSYAPAQGPVDPTQTTTQAPTSGSDAVNVTVKSQQGLFADVTRAYNVGDTFTLAVNLDMKGQDPINSQFRTLFDSNALKVTAQTINPILKLASTTNISEATQKEKNAVFYNFSTSEGCGLTTKSTIVTYTVEVLNVPGTSQTMTLDYQLLNAVNADPTQDPIKYIDQKAADGNEGPGYVQSGAENLFAVSVDVSESTVEPTEPTNTVNVTVKSQQGLFADVTRTYNVGDTFTLAVNLDMKGQDPINTQFRTLFDSNALKVTAQTINPILKLASTTNISEATQKEKNAVFYNFSTSEGCGLTTKSTIVTYTVEVLNVPGTSQTMTLDYQLLNAVNADPTQDPIKYIDQKAADGNEGPGYVQSGAENLFAVSVDVSASTVVPTEPTTQAPTQAPTQEPTQAPTQEPTQAPTQEPTQAPTQEPTEAPTQAPTTAPVTEVTEAPTTAPVTEAPTTAPVTDAPTEAPTTEAPTTEAPTTEAPTTEAPTQAPTDEPTEAPTTVPATEAPTLPAEGTFHVVAGDAGLCNGVNWDPTSALNLMTLGDDGIYRITYENVPAGTYNFKVTTNGAWDIADFNLLGDAKFGGANATITVETDGSKVTITLKESDMHANAYINDVLVDVGATEPTTVAPTEAPTTEPTTEAPTQAPTEPSTQTPTQPATQGGQSVSKVTDTIAKTDTDNGDVKGSKFAPLKVKAVSTKNKTVKLSWSKVSGAKGYIIYGANCGKTMKKLKTVSGKSYTFKNLKKGKYYKYMVVAYKVVNGKQVVTSISKIAHVAVKGGKYGNPTKITVKKIKPIKKGKKATIKATVKNSKKKVKTHVKLRYESTNTKIAKVTSKGKITAKKKGKCYIYVYAQNGVCKKVKITVK